jgi:hypothetical protein
MHKQIVTVGACHRWNHTKICHYLHYLPLECKHNPIMIFSNFIILPSEFFNEAVLHV